MGYTLGDRGIPSGALGGKVGSAPAAQYTGSTIQFTIHWIRRGGGGGGGEVVWFGGGFVLI